MEECKICYIKESNKKLPCGHECCSDCCVRFNSALCPYCRQSFTFTADEIKKRIQLGIINGYNWEVLPPGLALTPIEWVQPARQLNNITREAPEPYSRVIRNCVRRRRRNLSFDEVIVRRKEIQERKARHWDRKDGRLNKIFNNDTGNNEI